LTCSLILIYLFLSYSFFLLLLFDLILECAFLKVLNWLWCVVWAQNSASQYPRTYLVGLQFYLSFLTILLQTFYFFHLWLHLLQSFIGIFDSKAQFSISNHLLITIYSPIQVVDPKLNIYYLYILFLSHWFYLLYYQLLRQFFEFHIE